MKFPSRAVSGGGIVFFGGPSIFIEYISSTITIYRRDNHSHNLESRRSLSLGGSSSLDHLHWTAPVTIFSNLSVMVLRTCILRVLLVVAGLLVAIIPEAAAKSESKKWHLLHHRPSTNSESEITNNYVSQASSAKDSALVSYRPVQDFRKNQFRELQTKIQKQLPKESKFFDEFEGSECVGGYLVK